MQVKIPCFVNAGIPNIEKEFNSRIEGITDENIQREVGRKLVLEHFKELHKDLNDLKKSIGIKQEKYVPFDNSKEVKEINDRYDKLISEKETESVVENKPKEETKKEKPKEEAPIENKTKEEGRFEEAAKKLAEKVRAGKINKLGGFKTSTGFDAVWDASLEVVAKTLETTGKIADAIEAGLKSIKESDWYKGLTDKKDFEEKYRNHLKEEFEGNPPKPPKEEPQNEGGDRLSNKGILNRLSKAKGVPQASKEGFEKEGLKYVVKSREEAQALGKALVDELGIDEAVLLAEANKFKGGANSAIFAESLNRLQEQEIAAKTQEEKTKIAEKFAEISIRYDEFSREQGRDISFIDYFYKKSPLGVQLAENAKRKEEFEGWAKGKEQSWKDFFDELKKEPEFDAIVKEQVKEEIQKQRAVAREKRIERVNKLIDKSAARWAKKISAKGAQGAKKQGIGAEEIFKSAAATMKVAYKAGENVVEIVQKAIDFISEKVGHSDWGTDDFRKEWEGKLADEKAEKNPLTDEEVKKKILDRFRNKLKGLSDKQKEDVVRKSFEKIVESGGLDYADFRKIISDITGRGELKPEETARLKELVTKLNSVDDALKKAQTDRTDASLKAFKDAQLEAGKASRELSDLLYNKPDIVKRLTSIMQLNTLGIPALVNNPIYNIWNQATLRYPIGLINSLMDRALSIGAKVLGKNYDREYNTSLAAQKQFFKSLGFGGKESIEQFTTGLNREDYIQKEVYGENIRPIRSMVDLLESIQGKKKLSKRQVADKILQSTVGIPAEVVARVLNLGDKPQRFAAEGAQAAAFAKALGLKGVDYKYFIEFPREEAYRTYKAKGLSDAEAGKKADFVRDVIIKEGQRSTFQQDNWVNDKLNLIFGGKGSGVGGLAKSLLVSPYIKIPTNAFWSYYNLINPEIAVLQAGVHAKNAFDARKDGTNKSKLQMREARYWLAHAVVGVATRAAVVGLVNAGVFVAGNTGDEAKKEREGEQNFEPQGTVNISKLNALINGKNPDDVKNGITIGNRWFGQFGTIGNAIARKYEDATPEQREAQDDFWNLVIGKMEIEGAKEFQQGVFSNTSTLLGAVNDKGSFGLDRYMSNTINLFQNIVHPATLAQISRAQLPYYSQPKADTFLEELKNNALARSSLVRKLSGQYPPAKISIWGEQIKREGNVIEKLFGINHVNKDNFAQPIYEDAKRTGDIGYFPPAIPPNLDGVKLNTEQYRKLTEFVGKARKDYIAPFINNATADVNGFQVKYNKLPDDIKKKVLSRYYELGKEDGVAKFYNAYPSLKPKEEQPDYEQQIRLEIFNTLSGLEQLKNQNK